jgi:RHS repeat-associated protein
VDNHDGPAIDMVLADEQVYNELLWTLTDNQGSVRDLVDNAGTVESHIDYSSFGKVDLITDDLAQTLYGFTGRERDAETGLNYHRARYYDPVVGRWLSEDPISFGGGDTNLYRYVFNNSVLYTDPTGMFAQDLEGLINQFAEMGKKLMNGAANMPEEVKSALLDLTQLGLDVGGIFEPTPFCDITSGIMSGFRGDWWGAGTSVIGFLPGIGDLAKIARIGKYTDMLTNMVKVVGKHADIGATVMPILENLHKVIGNGMEMLGKLSEGAANAFGNFQNLLQQAIDKVGLGAKKVAGNGGCFIAGTDVVMAALPIPAEIREKYSLAPLWLPAAYTNAATVGVAAAGVAGYAASKRKRKRKPGKAQAGRKCAAGFRLDGWWR